jgi:hypothetical protein
MSALTPGGCPFGYSENEGCMLKKDYVYVLQYLEGYNSIPKVMCASHGEFLQMSISDGRICSHVEILLGVRRVSRSAQGDATELPVY